MCKKQHPSLLNALAAAALLTATQAAADGDPLDAASNHLVHRISVQSPVDGVNTGALEYGSEQQTDVAGSPNMEAQTFFYRYRDDASGDEELRVYFSVHDIELNAQDSIEFIFDRRHDHDGGPGEDTMVRILRGDCATAGTACQFARIARTGGSGLFDGAGTFFTPVDAQVLQSNAGEYTTPPLNQGWTGEFILRPQDLGWGYFPAAVGLMIRARSFGQNPLVPGGPAFPVATWPLNGSATVSEGAPLDWAHLKLRYPIDYALSLDYSGSMLDSDGLSDNRWVRAKRAADLFSAAAGLFKDDMLIDHISVSQYSWGCGLGGTDATGAVQGVNGSPNAMAIPQPPGDGSLTAGNDEDPASGNCTPIKRGIDFALGSQLGYPGGGELRERVLLLLSDGLHNRPASEVPLNPCSDYSAAELAFTQVRTVALGPDGSAGTDLLQSVSTCFGGSGSEPKYNQTSSFDQLLQAYIDTLQAGLAINQVPPDGSTHYAAGAPDKLVLIGVWNDPAQASQLLISRQDGCSGPWNPAQATDNFVNDAEIGYAAAVYDAPPEGACWDITGAQGGSAPDQEFVLADLRILARFLLEQKAYAAGDAMLLQVRLSDEDRAITGAQVSVEVARPGEGLGNFLSSVQDNCRRMPPTVPSNPKLRVDARGSSLTFAGAAANTAQSGADPKPLRYALAATRFEHCDMSGLPRAVLPGLTLYDDGSHGDLLDGDGIYSLAFTDTATEGSYGFRFHVRGTSGDGTQFARTRTYSQYVGIEPEPGYTQVVAQSGPMLENMQTILAYFIPRDGFENYLGPGFARRFQVSSVQAVTMGSVQDLGNGIYVQALKYPQGRSKPEILITSRDGGFEKTVDLDNPDPPAGAGTGYLGLLCLILLALAVIVALWLWYRFMQCRRRLHSAPGGA